MKRMPMRILGPCILLVAGIAGFLAPNVFTIKPILLRVLILSTALTLWFSLFEVLSAPSSKPKVWISRISIVFGAGVLFFTFMAFYLKRIPPAVLIPGAITIFVVVFVIILRRTLQNRKLPG